MKSEHTELWRNVAHHSEPTSNITHAQWQKNNYVVFELKPVIMERHPCIANLWYTVFEAHGEQVGEYVHAWDSNGRLLAFIDVTADSNEALRRDVINGLEDIENAGCA